MHPGRNELILADNVILVEGYTEEFLLRNYLNKYNYNWSIINVAGVMFEPYIKLAKFLNKKIIVISDTDIVLSPMKETSSRFKNLKKLCKEEKVKLIEMYNTLETDLYNNGFLNKYTNLLKNHKIHSEIYVAKEKKKTEIAEKIIEDNMDLEDWHVIKEIKNELKSN